MAYNKIKTLGIALYFLALAVQPSQADVGLIVALDSTWKHLAEQITINNCRNIAGRKFCLGKLVETSVVFVRSPMGKVNNAITTQILLSSYPIDAVISLSPAGAIIPEIKIGDLIVASEVYQHDFGTIKPYGFIWNKVPDGTGRNRKGYNFPDKQMRNRLLDYSPNSPPNSITAGVVVSGDQFISSAKKKQWLSKKFAATVTDMGAAAIAQVCYANKTPVCILRVVTDHADTNARPTFGQSVDGYRTSINLYELLEKFIPHINGTADIAENEH